MNHVRTSGSLSGVCNTVLKGLKKDFPKCGAWNFAMGGITKQDSSDPTEYLGYYYQAV